jgi:hypothetical protein
MNDVHQPESFQVAIRISLHRDMQGKKYVHTWKKRWKEREWGNSKFATVF